MNKLSVFVAIATLSLAAPALAQTPSDMRNGRSTVPAASSPEVKLDRGDSKSMSGDAMESKTSTSKHSSHHHHSTHSTHKATTHTTSHHSSKHSSHHHHHSDAAKTDAAKDTGDKK